VGSGATAAAGGFVGSGAEAGTDASAGAATSCVSLSDSEQATKINKDKTIKANGNRMGLNKIPVSPI